MATLNLSATSIKLAQHCPRAFFYQRYTDLDEHITKQLILGNIWHRFVDSCVKRGRRYDRINYYLSLQSMIRGWEGFWLKEKAKMSKGAISVHSEINYLQVGITALEYYWELTNKIGAVFVSGMHIRAPILPESDVVLLGTFDQLREIKDFEWAKSQRPSAFDEMGDLIEGIDPQLIIDFKLTQPHIGVHDALTDLALRHELDQRMLLDTHLQATIYTFLYLCKYGNWPFGVAILHMPSKTWHFKVITQRDIEELITLVISISGYIYSKRFPKKVGFHTCHTCDYKPDCAPLDEYRGILAIKAHKIKEALVVDSKILALDEVLIPGQLKLGL